MKDIRVGQVDPLEEGHCLVEGCAKNSKLVYKIGIGLFTIRLCKSCLDEIGAKAHEVTDLFKPRKKKK